MKERPILFSGPMVLAVLTCAKCGKISIPFPCEHCGSTDFQKTQTRRVVKHQSPAWGSCVEVVWGDSARKLSCPQPADSAYAGFEIGGSPGYFKCPYGKPGDSLWVREAWRHYSNTDECGCSDHCFCPPNGTPIYRATGDDFESKWKPSIHMRREDSRLNLTVKDIRVERVQEISGDDARAEGCPDRYVEGAEKASMDVMSIEWFGELWDSINGKRAPWESNPWVWVVTFEREATCQE